MTRKLQLLKDHAGCYVGDLIDATKAETRMLEAEGIATRIIGDPVEPPKQKPKAKRMTGDKRKRKNAR